MNNNKADYTSTAICQQWQQQRNCEFKLDILCTAEYLITGVPEKGICACHEYIMQLVIYHKTIQNLSTSS